MIILIVEDHKRVRELLRQWIEAVFPICKVLEASSGEEAVEVSRINKPQVILMDIDLPKMNGIEATKIIKSEQPEAKILVLTMHEGDEYRTSGPVRGVEVPHMV